MKLVPPNSPVLWQRASPVVSVAHEVLPRLPAMRQLCLLTNGLAIAAPQLGIGFRFFVVCASRNVKCRTVINPSITLRSPEEESQLEGCLSDPGTRVAVSRSKKIVVSYTDEHELPQNDVVLEGLEARVFLHEFDHLEGKCIFPRPT